MSFELIDEFRKRNRLDDKFDSKIISCFKDSIVDAYRSKFEHFISSGGLTWEDVGRELMVHPGTIWRWLSGSSKPDFNHILIYICQKGYSFSSIGFPCGRDVLLGAMASTLETIRQRLDGAECARLSLDEMEFLRFALSDRDFINVKTRLNNKNYAINKISHAYMTSHFNFGFCDQRSPSLLTAMLSLWFIPWVLFCDAVPYEWVRYRRPPHGSN